LNKDGSLDNTFNSGSGPNNKINAIVIQDNGKIIIGGDFTAYNGIVRSHITRLNVDGTIDYSFDPGMGADNNVLSIALQRDEKIIIGGCFFSYNGTESQFIARLDTNGSLDNSFNPGKEVNYFVQAIAIQNDDKIVVGGWFNSYNEITRKRIVRLNNNGTVDTTFDSSNGADNIINTVAVYNNGKILIGGEFNSYNGIERKFLALLNNDGTLDITFNKGTGANNIINTTLIQNDGKLLISGKFTFFNGVVKNILLA